MLLRSTSLLLLAAIAAPAVAQPSQGGSKSFRDWYVACDNQHACAAYAFPPAGDELAGYLKLTRDAGPAPATRITLGLSSEQGAVSGRATLKLDGAQLADVVLRRTEASDYGVVELSGGQVAQVIDAARRGRLLTLEHPGAIGRYSLDGAAAALRWLDEQQGRAGNVTALVAKGPAPAARVPARPAPPVVQRGPAVRQAGLPRTLSSALAASAALKDCDAEYTPKQEYAAHRLAAGKVLHLVPCSQGAYQTSFTLVLTDDAGRNPRLLTVPNGPGSDPASSSDLTTAEYDPAQRVLSAFAKGRGIADCGVAQNWVWDGAAFRLTEESVMGECRGVPPDDWPTTWHATVR